MPILSLIALFLGSLGAMFVCAAEYGISPTFFLRTSLDNVRMSDLWSGMGKTPVFGFIIAIIGCHFGLKTRGGTEGVGRSTTESVTIVSVMILITDFMLTRVLFAILHW